MFSFWNIGQVTGNFHKNTSLYLSDNSCLIKVHHKIETQIFIKTGLFLFKLMIIQKRRIQKC